MRKIHLVFFLLVAIGGWAQPQQYSVQNAHSHNDYEQARPLALAYEHRFGSIEADVYLVNGDLLVAHNLKDTQAQRTLKNLYLDPLNKHIIKNKGRIYPNKHDKLLLLIDCKSEGLPTLNNIISQLKSYPQIIKCKNIRIVITGNQPNKDSFYTYPSIIWFDGDLNYNYSSRNLSRIALFSANFKNYSKWRGVGEPHNQSEKTLEVAVKKAHATGMPIRFWGAPDNTNAWKFFKKLGVDYINTDHIEELVGFLQ